jgi:hypothetical protein
MLSRGRASRAPASASVAQAKMNLAASSTLALAPSSDRRAMARLKADVCRCPGPAGRGRS